MRLKRRAGRPRSRLPQLDQYPADFASPAQSAAVSARPGVVFSGSVDGHLRGYATDTVIWDYNAVQEYESTNGVPTTGGSFDGPGPTIVDGMLYVHSGYGYRGGVPGNALLAFSVKDE